METNRHTLNAQQERESLAFKRAEELDEINLRGLNIGSVVKLNSEYDKQSSKLSTPLMH